MSIAALHLTLPKQNLYINKDAIALCRDVLVNQILNPTDFADQFDKILATLHKLNRAALNGDVRLSLTEGLINHFLVFIRQVRCTEVALDLRQRRDLPDLNREFAFAAKLLLRDAAPHSKEELANIVYWTVSSLAEQLQDFSAQYRSQPGCLWAELNRLYQFAESHLLTDFQSNKPDHRDIASRYKQALLFQAAQPEHLNDEEQRLLEGYLRKWSYRGQLDRQENRAFYSHNFYIDLASPLGAQSSKEVQALANSRSVRVLDPSGLMDQARQNMTQLRTGSSAQQIGFPLQCDNIDAFMALKKALIAWQQASSRRYDRAPCLMAARTALGLNTIYRYLRSPQASPSRLINSHTINRSKIGACVKITALQDEMGLVSVGDVVMHYPEFDASGALGLVRWLKRTEVSIIFGFEFILGNLQPVTVRARDGITQALLISTADNDSLITYKGYCANNMAVHLYYKRDGISLDARAQSLIQRGQHVDQIRLQRTRP
ncbi:hypothetical protein [Reinekea sp.]|uniref:hypothetical protein n=1 Tax=Reinekea sp. TaxID=1970455 RepID=UPI002580060B|nr:hypothetical protein [Reinekea sp.]